MSTRKKQNSTISENQMKTLREIARIKGEDSNTILNELVQNYILQNAHLLVEKLNQLETEKEAN